LALRNNDDNWLNSRKRKVLTSKVIGSDKKFTKKEDKVEEKKPVDFLTEEELKQHMSDKNMNEVAAIFDLDNKTKASHLLPDAIIEAMKREMLKDLPVEELPKKDSND